MQARVAVEASIFGVAIAWLYAASSHLHVLDALPQLQPLLACLMAMLVAGTVATMRAHVYLPLETIARTRPENDTGILVGAVLLPLVGCSRLLVAVAETSTLDAYALVLLVCVMVLSLSTLVRLVAHAPWSLSPTALWEPLLVQILSRFLPLDYLHGTSVWPLHAALAVYNLLLRYGLAALPRSFTFGEAMVLSQGMSLVVVDSVFYTLQSMALFDAGIPIHEPTTIVIQLVLVSGVALGVLCTPLFRRYGAPSPQKPSPPLPLRPTLLFGGLVAAVGVVFLVWSSFLLRESILHWLFARISTPSALRVLACWALLLGVVVPLCPWIASTLGLRQIVARKLYHFLAVALFLPASLLDMDLLRLSYAIAIGLFFILECVRALSVPPMGRPIAAFMRAYLDHRDDGRIVLSHTYLLLGCALPSWLCPTASTVLLANTGVLALGIGDAMGAVVGSSVGRTKVCGTKTLEGSVAVFISMVLFAYAAVPSAHPWATPVFLGFLWSTWLTTALEAVTCQIDNLVLPLFYFATCCITQAYARG
ncbi:hypothetical protein SPRG_06315 [Saprolegnia parasitica CBS 223.65]|uniref:dolichol kinase n=1 Tax=Saprolegnia parasitica (strain CBS 223.65) TaxID=695850 RepID=A0A067CGI3_SAPPC|nr:hypothetical protein SPRG_06315 [Saprolegnia parasitica CBS 223.65]KDO28265.1 hypothetical protein SPRG_06315 [Saprolegnia parasitica CBS 223.65]|eukprot:XP_012201086.1 hypothetical protein SPRG_06315 [Saprolegnia parasitica CBS 223.65]